ncbi:MAG: ABC transporter ATP-binding protein [Magnetococcales bacterium]|nr:ABC transporter ATP-binding protein [Magnetococcales bacterium]
MAETMIEIVDLTRTYGPLKALDRINLQVARGQVMGFLGPNGAGKTTTMRILAGLLSPSEGTVKVGGIDLIDQPNAARARLGYLPESPPLYPELTVREYLTYLAQLRGVSADRRKSAVDRAMERCGLTHVAGRLLENVSRGYKQRAGIAQAIVHGPDVVILDEPTVGLDPIQIREIRALIRELGGEHSVLLSTHILPEVRMTCDRVAVIAKGKIVAEDSLDGLEARFQHLAALRVRWNAPPALEAVREIAGVGEVEPGAEGWLITPKKGADPTPELVRRSVEQGWDLRELTPTSRTLEEIFLNLTTTEAEQNGSAKEAA